MPRLEYTLADDELQQNRKVTNRSAFINLIGRRYDRLTVVADLGPGTRRWQCLCVYGSLIAVNRAKLEQGHTRSCGCLHRDLTIAKNYKHGLIHLPEYRIWAAMRERCTNPNNSAYRLYGGRGITVCTHWQSFPAFLKDMGLRPTSKHTIERKDNSLGYLPDNCKWATRVEQANNTRRNRHLTFNKKTHTLMQWARMTGIHRSTIASRIAAGDSKQDIFRPTRTLKGQSR